MWIRSQDKKILTEIHDVEIDSGFKVWGSGMLIGEYSTQDKALKVLDEIQKITEYLYPKVYQMPQDEEYLKEKEGNTDD